MIRYGIILTILACGAFGAPGLEARTGGGRIVSGTNAAPGQYPFQVSLRTSTHLCGGTIINPTWILTAANCVAGFSASSLSIQAGTNVIGSTGGGVIVQVRRIVSHAGYSPSNDSIHDIAVLELSTPLVFSNLIQAVKLPSKLEDTPGGTPATVIGWGFPYTGGAIMSKLQTLDIVVYSDKECQEIHFYQVYDSNICAGVPEGGKGQCDRDSGGPLLANGHQVGVVSWSVKPCGVKGYPGVFTEVAYYIDWINQQIQ